MTQEELNQKLFDTVYDKNIGGVREVLSLGADVNSADADGWTVLIYACANGYTDIARLLLEHGADINMINKNGDTALMRVCANRHTDIVKLLLEHNADVNAVDKYGNTALIWAAYNGFTDIANLLLEHGTNVNIKDNKGQTALDILQREYPEQYRKWISSMVRQVKRETLRQEDTAHAGRCEPDFDI